MKQQITLRLDANIIAWFKARARDGRGYQADINGPLRENVQRTIRPARPDVFGGCVARNAGASRLGTEAGKPIPAGRGLRCPLHGPGGEPGLRSVDRRPEIPSDGRSRRACPLDRRMDHVKPKPQLYLMQFEVLSTVVAALRHPLVAPPFNRLSLLSATAHPAVGLILPGFPVSGDGVSV